MSDIGKKYAQLAVEFQKIKLGLQDVNWADAFKRVNDLPDGMLKQMACSILARKAETLEQLKSIGPLLHENPGVKKMIHDRINQGDYM